MIVACSARQTDPTRDGQVKENEIQDVLQEEPVVQTSVADSSRHVARIRAYTCLIPDPAIDRASADRAETFAPIVHEIHAGLTRLSYGEDRVSVESALAEKYEVDDDGKQFAFTLRNDLKFSDGSALTTNDVKWSWERALKKSSPGGRAIRILGGIVGADGLITGRLDELAGVEIVDERKMFVHLGKARAAFPIMLTDPVAAVLNEVNVAQWPTQWTNDAADRVRNVEFEPHQLPVGAGPFMLVEFGVQNWHTTCRIVRNPHFWGESPSLDAVEFVTEPLLGDAEGDDIDFGAVHFARGEIDMRLLVGDEIAEIADGAANEPYRYSDSVGPATLAYIVFNPEVAPFDGLNFRRAIVSASDTSIFKPGDDLPVAKRIVPASLRHAGADASRLPFNPDVGREYWDDSSDSTMPPIVFYDENPGWYAYMFRQLFNQWHAELGVNVIISSSLQLSDVPRRSMLFAIHSPPYPDVHAVLSPIPTIFGVNTSPEMIELSKQLEEAAAELDAVERARKYLAAENYALDQALVLPIWSFEAPWSHIVQPWVRGFTIPRYAGSVFEKVSFDETAPKR